VDLYLHSPDAFMAWYLIKLREIYLLLSYCPLEAQQKSGSCILSTDDLRYFKDAISTAGVIQSRKG
jgi:hypothetical protein